jgi:cyclin H
VSKLPLVGEGSAKMPTEDDIYRSSTQFRNWTFTPPKLAAMRAESNKIAKEHIKAANLRRRNASSGAEDAEGKDKEVKDGDFLTVDEENTLVDYFCVGLLDMNETLKFSSSVIVSHMQQTI